MADALQEILAAQKAIQEQLDAQKELLGKIDDLDERMKALDEWKVKREELDAEIEKTKKKIERRPGLMGAEQKDFGPEGFSIMKALFDVKSEDHAFVMEYTPKSRASGGNGAPVQRAQSQSTDSEGGVLVPQQLLPGFVEQARERVKIWDPSLITVHENLSGAPVTLPTETGSTTVAWGGENFAPSDSSVTLSELTFNPNRLSGFTQVSRRLDLLSPMIETIVRRNLGRTVGIEIDRVLLRGSGTNNEPEGIANTSGILTVALATDGAILNFDDAQEMINQLKANNTFEGNIAFVSHPLVFGLTRKERFDQGGTVLGEYAILPMNDAQFRQAFGYDFLETTQIPINLAKGTSSNLSEVYCGNWMDLHLGIWQDLEFRVSDQATDGTTHAWIQDQVWILVNLTCDVEIARATSFVLINDAATTDPVS